MDLHLPKSLEVLAKSNVDFCSFGPDLLILEPLMGNSGRIYLCPQDNKQGPESISSLRIMRRDSHNFAYLVEESNFSQTQINLTVVKQIPWYRKIAEQHEYLILFDHCDLVSRFVHDLERTPFNLHHVPHKVFGEYVKNFRASQS
jgi:hypothetical protein